MSTLTVLLQIITSGLTSIEAGCASHGVQYPSLDDAITPESQAIQREYMLQALPVVAAAHQLVATLLDPMSYYQKIMFGAQLTTTLGIAEAGHVAEILRDAGQQGMHVSDICSHSTLNPAKLAHCLRFLSTHHVFKEVLPDHFAHNRVSTLLDTGKPLDTVLAQPEAKYDGAPELAALTATSADEFLKGASYIVEHSVDPKTSHSQEPDEGPIQRAIGKKIGLFSWYDLPENALRHRRFGNAMRSLDWSESILGGFDWSSLPEGSVVVDVGGGLGGPTTSLAKAFKHLRYICQDRPQTAAQGDKLWCDQGNQDVINGIVKFQGHDFFTEQPIKNASVFFLRFILHDWSDLYCTKILKALRQAATPTTKLVIIDTTLAYNCPSMGTWSNIPGGETPTAPKPLLPNYGIARAGDYYIDTVLMTCTNTQERTLGELVPLLESSGWKLEHVYRFPPPAVTQAIASPIF